jgi:hypothetical protein
LIEIARAETEEEAKQGLERWRERHPESGYISNRATS